MAGWVMLAAYVGEKMRGESRRREGREETDLVGVLELPTEGGSTNVALAVHHEERLEDREKEEKEKKKEMRRSGREGSEPPGSPCRTG